MKLDIGTPVRYPDGEQVGTIHKVIFDPQTAVVQELVLETPELVGRLVLVPSDLLREDPGDVLTLDATREDVDAFPDYEVERFLDNPEGWTQDRNYVPGDGVFSPTMFYPVTPVFEESNAPEGAIEWSQGTEVICTDGRFGVVDEVIVDSDTAQITGVVVRPDDEALPRLYLPLAALGESDSQVVQINCTQAELPGRAEVYDDPTAEPETDSLLPST